ncbi:TonB-dependent receptor [Salegentibacter sp. Hel_I_6]|uniref:TonB-dependent receptor n=1 Tax=Salegentibacter sp. Hel_I_6 TaxID=1250278 RepID=UPI00056462A8|nr:TonB-dependent receptor [Salegentibacter sp. Hel_I_6]
MSFKNFLNFLLFFIISGSLFASNVWGVITDAASGELMTGANITYKNVATGNLYQTVSGLDGSYVLRHMPAGEYQVSVSYVGYLTKQESLTKTQEDLTYDIALEVDDESLGEVLIVSDNRGTDAQARALERQSANVLNIISAKQIELSPDITVANVIQRVSGLSIERNSSGDPQYAIIRGMDKRYNNTLINGIKIPSPDNENRFVPLDIFPAVFLERLEVYKSLTANMEADAIGGTVNMVMKDAPVKEYLDADIQLGVNHLNFERGFDTYDRSGLNKLSPSERFGEDYRATPEDFPTENMIQERRTPMPDVFANISYGNRYFDNKLGVMLGGSFQNSYRPTSNYFYDPSVDFREGLGNPLIMQELIERETSAQFQRIAFHSKLDYQFNDDNKLDLYFGKYYLNEFRVRDQERRESFVATNNYAVYPITRFSNIYQDITTIDLGGEHRLADYFDLDWNAIYSLANNDRPDDGVFARAGNYNVEQGRLLNEIVYFQGANNSRAWERNRDDDISLYFNVSFQPNIINKDTEFQFGGVLRKKVRDNYYNYYNYAQIFGQFRGEDWNDFGDVNFNAMANPRGSGDDSNLVYDATEDVYATYFNTKWVLGGTEIQAGLRTEQTYQGYEINELSASSNDVEISQRQDYLDFFPSLSLKQRLTEKANLKATYFKGISRPGFYEIVPTVRSAGGGDSFYSERGNADLRPSYGHSADLRYEFFPNSIDQILLGVFYKRITDPIEYGFPLVSGEGERPVTNRILPQNYDDATNFGVEFDFTKYINKFGLRLNYTYTNSQISTNKIVINEDRSRSLVNQTRPLQGQSDHIGNVSLLYKDLEKRWDIQLVVNYTGERIAFVSPFFDADHYMRPMTQMDFSLEKGLNKNFVLFFKGNNLLNTPYQLVVNKPLARPEDPYPYQTDPTNMGFIRRDLYGVSFRVGARYKF